MAEGTCWNITLIPCELEEPTCETCCAVTGDCIQFSIVSDVAGGIGVGNIMYQGADCKGEVATAGIYHDCPTCPTQYGCITIGAAGAITAIANCTGENSCGSGVGSCGSAGTLNSNQSLIWGGRNRNYTTALNTWDTIYERSPTYQYNPYAEEYVEFFPRTFYYVKQIYISNCSMNSEHNVKEFSVRFYNSTTTYTTNVEGTIGGVSQPMEMLVGNRVKLGDGESISLLGSESPLKLCSMDDIIQFQSHTALNGFNISIWLEPWSQYYNERKDNPQTKFEFTPGEHASGEGSSSIGGVSMSIGRTVTGTPNKTSNKE